MAIYSTVQQTLQEGTAIPAHPLALTSNRKLDERRQRALTRYYVASGVGGLAVGVHTTQFQIRDARIGLFHPVLQLAAEEMNQADLRRTDPLVRVGGICGNTSAAVCEAQMLRDLAYHAGLVSLAALRDASDDKLIEHCRQVANVIPIIGFYLQPSVGGRLLSYQFWRRFCEIENVIAIKISPFNRYQTLDVVRATVESGRDDIALFTGNDDNIVLDLLTPYRIQRRSAVVQRRIVGGLLGHWSVWTKRAAELHQICRSAVQSGSVSGDLLATAIAVTDCNAAFFDVANSFRGCIPGLHEVLRRQGLLAGTWCLDPEEALSDGQLQEIDRVYAAYPELNDDQFVLENRDKWLK